VGHLQASPTLAATVCWHVLEDAAIVDELARRHPFAQSMLLEALLNAVSAEAMLVSASTSARRKFGLWAVGALTGAEAALASDDTRRHVLSVLSATLAKEALPVVTCAALTCVSHLAASLTDVQREEAAVVKIEASLRAIIGKAEVGSEVGAGATKALGELEVAPMEVAPMKVAPMEVAPMEVAPMEVAPIEVAHDYAPQEGAGDAMQAVELD
jgi:hypothetical protein